MTVRVYNEYAATVYKFISLLQNTMDAHIERHQPLITARLVFGARESPPPPIITARMEFPSFSIPQHRERSMTPNPMTSGKRASTPKRHSTPKRASIPKRNATPRPSTTPESNMIVDLDTTPKRAATPKRHATPQRGATPSTARRRGTSVAFEDMGSPLSSLSDEEDELESEGDIETSKKIPKPQGEVGRPHSGGYSLQEALDWNDKTYDSVMVSLGKCLVKYSDETYRFSCIKWRRPG